MWQAAHGPEKTPKLYKLSKKIKVLVIHLNNSLKSGNFMIVLYFLQCDMQLILP